MSKETEPTPAELTDRLFNARVENEQDIVIGIFSFDDTPSHYAMLESSSFYKAITLIDTQEVFTLAAYLEDKTRNYSGLFTTQAIHFKTKQEFINIAERNIQKLEQDEEEMTANIEFMRNTLEELEQNIDYISRSGIRESNSRLFLGKESYYHCTNPAYLSIIRFLNLWNNLLTGNEKRAANNQDIRICQDY
jgi:hypothetical protein